MNNETIQYVVKHISYLPDGLTGEKTSKSDDRTRREKWFETKEAAVEYIKEVQEREEEWLMNIGLQKAVFSNESW